MKKTKDGRFRGFAFIGFKTEDEATNARDYFNGTYFGAAKIDVQTCSDLGDAVKFSKKDSKQVRDLNIYNISRKSEQKCTYTRLLGRFVPIFYFICKHGGSTC